MISAPSERTRQNQATRIAAQLTEYARQGCCSRHRIGRWQPDNHQCPCLCCSAFPCLPRCGVSVAYVESGVRPGVESCAGTEGAESGITAVRNSLIHPHAMRLGLSVPCGPDTMKIPVEWNPSGGA